MKNQLGGFYPKHNRAVKCMVAGVYRNQTHLYPKAV